MSVLITPGLSGILAIPGGSSCAIDLLRPSIAHLDAQYGATSGDVLRPQPELRLSIIPVSRFTIAGTKALIQKVLSLLVQIIMMKVFTCNS